MKLKSKKIEKYTIISSIFVLICLIFVARLINLQLNPFKTAELRSSSEYTTETVTIQALRGNICDRNGTILATTSYAYDIIFDYNYMPDGYIEFHETILSVLEVLNSTQSNEFRTSDLFPFVGEYPNFEYSEEAVTKGSSTYSALNRMLTELNMENASAEELVKYFVKRWKLGSTDKSGNPVFTNEEIGALIRVRYDMLRTQFSSSNPYCIASGVDVNLVAYIKELGIVGVSDKINSKRTYLYPGYASHILGRVGSITAQTWEYYKALGYKMSDSVGIDGCEAEFEEYQRGKDGVMTIKRNANGDIIKEEITVEPIVGKDVWLTIDIETQIATEDALKQYMKDFNKNEGASVAIDPSTGDILAIASYPTYDLTTFNKDYTSLATNEHLPLLNRACYAVYAPGSTFKVAVSLAGLQEGAISSSTKITCNHGYKLHGINVDCSNHNDYPYSSLNVIEALTFSCNAFFMETGYDRLNIDTMTDYCVALGLGQSTGIEIPELTGQIANPENALSWGAYEEASSYIGQSIHQYSPLQITSYIATVANGGTRYSTHLLHSVRKFSGEVVKEYEKQILSTVDISDSTLSTIKNGMKNMIENSSTSSWNMYDRHNIGVTVCGKSGTAQIGGGKQNCWFTAFAPMNNPQIVVTSIIENGSSGASVSAIDAAVIAAYLNQD